MPRIGADDRLRRLLALIPWVAAREGPAVEEVCARFDVTEQQLAEELEVLFMCGLHPFSPDMLIEADIADGRVWIRYADFFSRPLRLTAAEGLALVASGAALLAVPGTEAEGPLARGLAKVAAVLGLGADGAVEVDLPPPPAAILDVLQRAAADHHRVEIDYYAYGKDERTTRTIEPWLVFSAMGQWYVQGWCLRAGGERSFRLDRVERAQVLDETFRPPRHRAEPRVYRPRPDDPSVTLDLDPAAAWVAEQYPTESVDRLPGGRLRVRLRVSELPWLERLLLRLGPAAVIVDGDRDVAAVAARRVLQRYRSGRPVVSDAS
ncbi:MAG TPA: WYL domain-containing protein [Acidimicrobiales bacterium]|nr:WYL domain-containing protein [Acidimicrobiales bacterium]